MNLAHIIYRLAQVAEQLDTEGREPEATAIDGAIAQLSEPQSESPIHALLESVVEGLKNRGMPIQELLTHKGQDALRAELLRVLNDAKYS